MAEPAWSVGKTRQVATASRRAVSGGGHRLRHQRQHPGAQPAPGLAAQLGDHRLGHGGLHHQARLRGGPGHRDTAYRLALQAVIAAGTASAAEASSALAST